MRDDQRDRIFDKELDRWIIGDNDPERDRYANYQGDDMGFRYEKNDKTCANCGEPEHKHHMRHPNYPDVEPLGRYCWDGARPARQFEAVLIDVSRLTLVFDGDAIKAIDPVTKNGFYLAKLDFQDSNHITLEGKRQLIKEAVERANESNVGF